jgi:DNA polymerase III delta prime subunit
MERKRPLHVEIAVYSLCPVPLSSLKSQWQDFLQTITRPLPLQNKGRIDVEGSILLPEALRKSCQHAYVLDDDDEDDNERAVFLPGSSFVVHLFYLSQEEASTEELEPTEGDDEWTAGCDSLPLPHTSVDGLWDNLIYDSHIKRGLLDYAQSALLFSDKSVSDHVVHWNRILLLHGPPGTGKTSLCRALAHKLAIRLDQRFPRSLLLEIHSHSLFSKWFSTSGKLVSTLFQMVRDMVQDDPSTLVCVLVDEVESLASSRANNQSGGDPSDAMRAVNSLLTSLDRLRSFPNVLILATTNLTRSVDAAFVDRVDLKVHIGMPILKARYQILRSCVQELERVGIIIRQEDDEGTHCIPSYDEQQRQQKRKMQQEQQDPNDLSSLLLSCAQQAEGLSGRSLRRLPLQAHAQYLHGMESVLARDFLQALTLAIQAEQSSRQKMTLD